MAEYNEISATCGYAIEFPKLPETALTSAQELHEGKLWAWHSTRIDGEWYLAVVAANLPRVRPIKNIVFESQAEAELAGTLHNQQRGLSVAEVHRIVESTKTAELEFVGGVSEAFAKADRH